MEFAYAQMAMAAGVHMPPTRLIPVSKSEKYFAARRFDRLPGNQRLHMHTFANLIHANFRIPSTDYADLLRLTSALTRNHADVVEAFRRMVFNIAAHNRDDHAKNFSFLMNPAGEWSLSPAYDIIFSTGPGGEHTMSVAGEGSAPAREHILKVAEQTDLKLAAAKEIIDAVNQAVARWPQFAEQAGVTKKTTRRVAAELRSV
jgi:serine/threonine-protein kinase HipA